MSNQSDILSSHLYSLCFQSLNNSCTKMHFYSPVIKALLYSLLGAIILLTVLGNLLVVITILHFKQLHTPTNYLILSLAVADLLVGALLMPFMMVHSVESCWYTGQFHCSIHSSLSVILCATSILNLCFIALDRYLAVCHPLRYQTIFTPSVTASIVSFPWIVGVIFGFCAYFVAAKNKQAGWLPHDKTCEGACELINNTLSGILFSTLIIYFPGIILVCIYIKIYQVAKRQAMSIQDKHKCVRKSNVPRRTEIKATRTLAIVLGVFLTSWLPFYISSLLNLLPGYSPSISLLKTFTWVATLNSMCNPIIYGLFYSWFRRALKLFLFEKAHHRNSSDLSLVCDS